MNIQSVNTKYNTNFNGKLKLNKQAKTNLVNELTVPVLMGVLTAQILKEQELNTSQYQQNKGYLKSQPNTDELIRGEKLVKCFNFFKTQEQAQVIANIIKIMTKQDRNINDIFFINNLFEFIESDLSLKAKSAAFEILSKPDNKKLLQTTLTNYSTLSSDFDKLEARFSIPDMLVLQDIYSSSKNKELVLDMIKEGIVIDDNGIKTYRFELNEINKLNKCYTETPHKDLFLALINQYEYNEEIDEDCPLYNADMIIRLVKDCVAKNKAEFLTQICNEKIIRNGKIENRFKTQIVFIFNEIYKKYPNELEFLTKQNNNNIPRFNSEEIITLINKYKIIGEPLIRIVKETNNSKNIDFTSLMLFINEVEKQQVLNNKKKIFN